jgi:uncharacterized integral membrane protein
MADQHGYRPVKTRVEKAVDHYFEVLEKVQVNPTAQQEARPQIDINDEIAREQKIKNDNAEQDIELKRKTLLWLFRFLVAESALIFIFSFMQAVQHPWHFHLDEWSFKLVVTATLAQITGMLFVAVRYLFPANNGGKNSGSS